ncbi:hypothetical protein [Candidatus Enterococcus clewellii]|uniref:hypothetical protein n=1 Tax=Candidatus Enterococcus clewellii TaxID=1834193 RepID=UPI0030D0F180
MIKEGNQKKQELGSAYKYVSLDPPLEIVDYSIAHERWIENAAYTLDERVLLIRLKDT